MILPGLALGAAFHAEARAVDAARGPLAAADAQAPDFAPFPPALRQATSPNGRYLFEVRSTDGWRTRHATGRLLENTTTGPRLAWQGILPQEYGPRYFLIGNRGQAILFDESINVKSRYAISLITPSAGIGVRHDFDAVRRTLGLSASTITRRATSGWWLQGPPSLDATATVALAPAGDQCLAIELDSGRLSLARRP